MAVDPFSRRMIASILVLSLFITIGAALVIWRARQHALDQAFLQANSLVQALDHHASRAIESVDLALNVVVDRLERETDPDLDRATMHRFLQDRTRDVTHIDRLFVTTAAGDILFDGDDDPVVPLNVASQAYFSVHKADPHTGLYVSEPLRVPGTDRWVLVVSRRLSAGNGSFGGIAAAIVDLSYFQSFYENARPGERGSVALLTVSGRLIARAPSVEVGKDMRDSPLYATHLPKADQGTFEVRSIIDGISRLISYRRVAGQPFVVFAAVSKDDALARWRDEALYAVVGVLSLILLLVLTGMTVGREIARRRKAELEARDAMARLEEQNEAMMHQGNALRTANDALHQRTLMLEARSNAIDLLSRMAHRLQSCTGEDELAETVRRFAPEILPGVPGVLYLLNNSRSLLRAAAIWNRPTAFTSGFRPEDCWALRRGQAHSVDGHAPEVGCRHQEGGISRYRCFPIMAQNETLGLLYLEHPPAGVRMPETSEVEVLVENIALALGNYRLREALRLQSIRDPLTGLFNRRYLDETLEIEVARARRESRPIGVIMLDVDHFKRFNDSFGHDAGDVVLKAVADVMTGAVRRGDIACRYGGEEFTILLPGAGLDDTVARAEALREAVKQISASCRDRLLGRISCSLGVAAYPGDGTTPADMMAAADQALLRAKSLGRDRVEAARPRNVETLVLKAS